MIAERTAFALRRVAATAVSASQEGLTTVTDALSAKAKKTIAGLGRCEESSKRPLVRGWSVDGTPVTRCDIHGTGSTQARRHECRTARER